MIVGLDVSYAQGRPDWLKVKETDKVSFVYARASYSDGHNGPDTSFSYNWLNLAAVGLRRGAYHFFTASADPVKQADAFFKAVGKLRDTDLPPMIDVEVDRLPKQTPAQYAKNVRAFMERAEELFKRRLVVYTGGPVFTSATTGADEADLQYITDHDLWLAAYVTQPDKYVPAAWSKRGKTWTIWQKSGDKDAHGNPGYRIAGINNVVDLNVAQGNAADLDAWVESSKIKEVALPVEVEVDVTEHVEPVQPLLPPPPQPIVPVPPQPSGLWALILQLLSFIVSLFTGGRSK